MRRRLGFLFALVAVFLLGRCTPAPDGNAESAEETETTATGQEAEEAMPATPSIEGTYRFVYRELPDGTRIERPQMDGLLTFTNGLRNFSLREVGAESSAHYLSSIGTYSLTETEYTENQVYRITASDGGLEVSEAGTASAPVTWEGDVLTFTLPHDEPAVRFDGDRLTATIEGAFVDHWERVD